MNIAGLINFDAPFFGVSNRVVSETGLGKVSNIVEIGSKYCSDIVDGMHGLMSTPLSETNATKYTNTNTNKETAEKVSGDVGTRDNSTIWKTGLAVISSAALIYGFGASTIVQSAVTSKYSFLNSSF